MLNLFTQSLTKLTNIKFLMSFLNKPPKTFVWFQLIFIPICRQLILTPLLLLRWSCQKQLVWTFKIWCNAKKYIRFCLGVYLLMVQIIKKKTYSPKFSDSFVDLSLWRSSGNITEKSFTFLATNLYQYII